ncbi:MAG: hypothetical protein C4521_13560 [Actinobacteria bacterium]|nr:MAG: hypothetical protein C4521_13560 [Actinomycetota bacterium]
MERGRWIELGLAVALILVIATVVTGCPPQQNGAEREEEARAERDPGPFVEAWAGSLHAVPVTFAAEEEECVRCHDGGAFAQGVASPAEIDRPTPFGPYVVATDCRACHTGQGSRLLQSQEVTIPTTSEPVRAGTGSLCMKCHNERRAGDINDPQMRQPHYGPQAGVLTATGGIRTRGFDILSTRRHQTVRNACVNCHMAQEGGESHSFRPTLPPCRRCHEGLRQIEGLRAKADYDGDGTREPFVNEVDGLMSAVASATARRSGEETFTSAEGRIFFKSDDQTAAAGAVDEISYLGAYNWFVVSHDGSRGLHNPYFTVTLLQDTYRAVAGRPLPNARRPQIEEEERGRETTPSGEATPSGETQSEETTE